MATYASIDKVMQSMGQVSLYSGLNKAKIISHDDERQQINYGVNQENMMEYADYLGINPNEISTSYGDYKPRRVRSPPKPHYMVSSGRGKLLSRAFQETGITPEYQTFTKLKRHMSEAGIDSTSNRDVTSAFYEMFKKRDDEIPEESSYASSYSSKQSTTSQSEFSSEEFDDDRFKLDDDNRYKLDENRYKFDENTFKLHEIAFPKTPSPSDLNNNDSKREGRRREERPVKTSVYVPPCRRKQEEVTKPVEIKEEEVSFAELIRQAEERKKAEKLKTVARRKTPSELLADPCWVEKPKEENLGAKPKCRNAVLSQFLPKNEQPVSKPNAIPAGMESDDDLDIFEKDSSPNNEEAPAFSWIPAEKVPIARSLIENFIPEEHQKPKPLTLGDFLNNPPTGGTSKKKSLKKK